MWGIENTFQELKDGYKEVKDSLLGNDSKKEEGKKAVVGWAAEKVAMARTQTEAFKLKQDIGKVYTPSSSAEIQSTTEKKYKTTTAVSEIERVFNEEVFDTEKFKNTDGILTSFLGGDKVKKAKEMKVFVTTSIGTAMQILSGIQNDTDLQKNYQLKNFHTQAVEEVTKNQNELNQEFPWVYGKIVEQLNIIKWSIYGSAQIAQAPSAPSNDSISPSSDTLVREQKTMSFLTRIGFEKDGWTSKIVIGLLGAFGLFKAGSWIDSFLDWTSDPIESLKKKTSSLWQSPLKWIEGKWDETTSWAKGIFGLDSVPHGIIATDGKTYNNDTLKISMDATNKSLKIDSTSYELGVKWGTISTLSFEKWDDKTGDYAVINGQKIPMIALKKRIESNTETGNQIIFAENFEGNNSLVLNKKA